MKLYKIILCLGALALATPAFVSCSKDDEPQSSQNSSDKDKNKADEYYVEYNQYIARISAKFDEMKEYGEGSFKDSLRNEIEYMQKLAREIRQKAAKEGITIKKSPYEDRDPWAE